MKKSLLVLGIFLGSMAMTFGQGTELGARFGAVRGGAGVAFDAVFSMGQFNRLHADVGLDFDQGGLYVEILDDFLYRPLGGEAFYWYVGAGVGLGVFDDFILAVPFEIGLEYKFNTVPLTLGIDYRPELQLTPDFDFNGNSIGLNVRYRLGG